MRKLRTARAAILAVALAGGIAGCSATLPSRRTTAAAAQPAPVPNLFEAQRAIAEYVDSGRYAADFEAAVAPAIAWLETRAPQVAKPAIVLDIDETSLSNWQAYRVNQWARIVDGPCDLERGPCGLRAWQAMARAPALAPTRRLVDRARALGVAVFFISGRPAEQQAATERNLREQGYQWDRVVVLPKGKRFASAVDFKAAERRHIAEHGYTILLTMGDQQSDLEGGSAERTFKLPNPVYFLP